MRLSVPELRRQTDSITRISQAELQQMSELLTEVEQMINENKLQGRSYSSAKRFLIDFHRPVIRGAILLSQAILEANQNCINRLNMLGDNSLHVDTAELTLMVQGLERMLREMMELDLNALDRITNDMQFSTHLRSIQEQVERVNQFHMQNESTYAKAEELLRSVQTGVAAVASTTFHAATNTFTVPSVSSAWRDHINQAWKEWMRMLAEFLKGNPQNCAIGGDPVNLSTGNFIYTHTDLEVGGRVPLTFCRFYNTIDTYQSTLGRNWCHNYDIRLIAQTEERICILFEDGHQEYYQRNEQGEYTSPEGVFHRLIGSARFGYTLTKQDQSNLEFDKAGKLIMQTDSNGNEIHFTYTEGKLTKISSVSGSFTFVYKEDQMILIRDHAGRTVQFIYKDDLLTTYVDPLGHCFEYGYDQSKRLIRVVNPEGNQVLENIYDEDNRVIKQIFADHSEVEYRYHNDSQTTEFIQQNGHGILYRRDERYRTTAIVYPDGEEIYEFNSRSQKTLITDPLGYQTRCNYDDEGNLIQITNALGVKAEIKYNSRRQPTNISINGKEKFRNGYDEAGNLTIVADALNQKTKILYTPERLPEAITQPDGSRIYLTYDERGNIIQVIDGSGIITKYKYDSLNRVIATIDGNKNQTEYQYNSKGNITEVKNAAGDIQTYTYNKNNKVTSITDFDGSIIRREYNVLGKPSRLIDQLGRKTELKYNKMWNVTQVTQPNGAETYFHYNQRNRLEKIQKPGESITTFQYDVVGNRTGITDEADHQTNFVYDGIGQLIEVTGSEDMKQRFTYDAEGNATSVIDAAENTVNLIYDELGQLIQEINALGGSRIYTYTALGKVESITDEAGRKTRYTYELGGRLSSISYPDNTKEHFRYDANGNIKTHTDQAGIIRNYIYDSLNRVIEIITHVKNAAVVGDDVAIVPKGIKKFSYDAVGNVTGLTDENGNTTHYEYTRAGQLAKVIDPLGNEIFYNYDVCDHLLEVIQSVPNSLRITRYTRNIQGEITTTTNTLGQEERFCYDPKGQLIKKIDREGYLTKYDYTAHGDVKHIQYADGKEVKLSYNSLRQLTEIGDWLGLTKIEVDALGRPTTVTDHQDRQVQYTWGNAGERREIIYPDGKQVTYQYDQALRLTEVNDGVSYTKYTYDDDSRLSEKIFQNGTKSIYHYNELGQLKELSYWNQEELLDRYQYDYDMTGNKTGIRKERTGIVGENALYTYKYDPLNRLQKVLKDDKMLRSYTYDDYGNRTKMSEGENQTTYIYNALNQLVSSKDTAGAEQRYVYDKRGNCTEIYKNNILTNQYHFGSMNRLEQAFNHEKMLGAAYQYNGLGHRIGKVEGTALEPIPPTMKLDQLKLNPTKQVEDVLDFSRQFNNLLQRTEDGQSTAFTWDFSVLSANQADGETLRYLHDDLGSPIRVTGRNEDDIYSFDEFGVPLSSNRNTSQPFGFAGYQHDPIADTLFAGARQYSPQAGRFVSADTHWHTGI